MEGMINYQNKKNRITPWLNQYYATSGNVPSENVLNQIIQSELEQAYQDRMRQQQLALQREQLDAQKSMWDAQRGEWKNARKDREQQLLWGGLGQLGTAAIGALGREGLSDLTGWIGKKWDAGTEYAKNALGFGNPLEHADRTEQLYSNYYKNPTEGISGEENWKALAMSNPTQFSTVPRQTDNSAFNYNTPTASTPVRQGGAAPVRPAAMPAGTPVQQKPRELTSMEAAAVLPSEGRQMYNTVKGALGNAWDSVVDFRSQNIQEQTNAATKEIDFLHKSGKLTPANIAGIKRKYPQAKLPF